MSVTPTSRTDSEEPHSPVKLDWVHLPSEAATASRWDSLHDGKLTDIRSDLLARKLQLKFEICHLAKFHKLSPDPCFTFEFKNVSSVRATRSEKWPGGLELSEGLPLEEQRRLTDE